MAAAPGRRRLHPALRLVVLQSALVALLLVGELLVRWFAAPPAMWRRLPDAAMWTALGDGELGLRPAWSGRVADASDVAIEVTTNSLGMRDREFPAKEPGERRLLLLGDEVVFGTGVASEQALPAQLQQALQGRGEAWTVGNGGVPRSGSSHAARRFERLDAGFAPDAVVLCGNLGDDTRDDLEPARTVYGEWLLRGPQVEAVQASWRARLCCRSALVAWLELARGADGPVFAAVPEPLAELGERSFAGLFLDVGDGDPCWGGKPPDRTRWLEPLRAALRAVRDRADRRPLLFVVVPTRWQLGEGERLDSLRRLGFRPLDCPRGAGQQRWLAVAEELGVPAIDATPALAGASDCSRLFDAAGSKLSRLGHEVLAQWLVGEIPKLLYR